MSTENKNSHVIIIGCGFAGLLTAAVVSRYFAKVTIIEPDRGIEHPLPRNAAPQANHAHVLVNAGLKIVQELFPKLQLDDWKNGGKTACYTEAISGVFLGAPFQNFKSSLMLMLCDRAKFEFAMRQDINALPNVETLIGYRFDNYVMDRDNKRVTGVEAVQVDHDHQKIKLDAGLVIDCSGRASRTSILLKKYGYPEITEHLVNIGLQYASQDFEFDPSTSLPWQLYFSMKKPPNVQNLVSCAIDNNRVIVTAQEIGGTFFIKDQQTFMGYIEKVVDKPVYNFLTQHSKPATELKMYLIPTSYFRRYDLLPNWPNGLLVLGDAVSVYNPKYGSGMSAASLEVKKLNDYFQKLNKNDLTSRDISFEQAYQKDIAKNIVGPYYDLLACTDLMLPNVDGYHPKGLKFLQWYAKNMLEVAATDHVVMERFLQVANLNKLPPLLFHPGNVIKVLKHAMTSR